MFFSAYLITALLGISGYPYLFTFHLLDLVAMSTALQNVVQAMVIPRKALGMTALLGFITIYIFSTIAFFTFHQDISSPERDFMTYELGHFPLRGDLKYFLIRVTFDLMSQVFFDSGYF